MGRGLNFLFGALLILIGLNSIFSFVDDMGISIFIIGVLGVLILFVFKDNSSGFFKNIVLRWIFGLFLVLSAFGSLLLSIFPGLEDFFVYITYGTFSAGLIIAFIGVIYFFSSFKKQESE